MCRFLPKNQLFTSEKKTGATSGVYFLDKFAHAFLHFISASVSISAFKQWFNFIEILGGVGKFGTNFPKSSENDCEDWKIIQILP